MAALNVERLSKRYGAVQALNDVSLTFVPGEIHALLGENGAGKSTFVNVLSGFVLPDSGTVALDGIPLPLGRPHDCRRAGIAMVHQHFTLVPEFTVEENMALDRMEGLTGSLHLADLARPALALAEDLGWQVNPKSKVRNLPVGTQQRIEILRVLADDSPVVILDEPTATLAPVEVADLFRVLRELRNRDKIVILIAHKLSEVMSVADTVSVLRNGKLVAGAAMSSVDEAQLAQWMVGELPAQLSKAANVHLGPGLTLDAVYAKGDRGQDALRGITLEVGRGEIVGIGGVDGNGQLELAEVAANVRPVSQGSRIFEGHRDEERIAYIPQDRQADGLAVDMSVEDNLLIEGYRRSNLTRGPFLDSAAIRKWSQKLIDDFQIKTAGPTALVGSMSGGNQQKVVVSRNLDAPPDLLVCFNPTRGLDIRAADFVHRQILRARDEGAAVLLISTDLEELAALGDRSFFLVSGELKAAEHAASLVGGA